MESEHRTFVGDSREMSQIGEDEVELIVTSPPYPMIEMWDDLFAGLSNEVFDRLKGDDGKGAFEAMHTELNKVWDEISRVLVPGGIACINIGDATRKVDNSFQVYPNHVRVIDSFLERGFQPLPDILWRKPANSAAKFMGSGMLPPNAYATLEHEYILIFRNEGRRRRFTPGSQRRYSSAYFWEERNEWFSDMWMDVRGTLQELNRGKLRERSGAFPLELPLRLINMYSVYGDTVLDPFWGTGTTSMAAMIAGRNSVGYELQQEFMSVFHDRVDQIPSISHDTASRRLQRHREFVHRRLDEGEELKYTAQNYDFPVTTKQEKRIQFYTVDDIQQTSEGHVVSHTPFDEDQASGLDAFSSESAPAQSILGSDFD